MEKDLQTPPVNSAATAPAYRVVIIKDNVALASVLKRLIEKMGHEAAIAHDGNSGLELVRSMKPDVVLSAIEVPLLNGYQIASEIRRTLSKQPLVVAITGYSEYEIGTKAKEAGFDLVLSMPVSVAELTEAFTHIERGDYQS
jgi:CheY-like chemotaxis protein